MIQEKLGLVVKDWPLCEKCCAPLQFRKQGHYCTRCMEWRKVTKKTPSSSGLFLSQGELADSRVLP
jgi:hypothetical protein